MGAKDGDFTIALAVRVTPTITELGKFCFVSTGFDQRLRFALEAETVKRCTYLQWLGAEAVRLAYLDDQQTLQLVTLSREMMIKRVANTLDGSHPSASGSGADNDNQYNAPVHYLLEYKLGGLPLPYFILLKIAQDLLSVAPRLLSRPREQPETA